jgi:homoserine dehydrogenase
VGSAVHRLLVENVDDIERVGAATLVDDRVDVRVRPCLVDRHHPLAAVEGAFNAVMLQGDAIREIALEGPGAGGTETASAVVAVLSIIGTSSTGFLQNDATWRTLERLPPGELRSPYYVHLQVADRPGVLAEVAGRLAAHDVYVARLVQVPVEDGAALHVVLHEARQQSVDAALAEIAALPEVEAPPSLLPVISDRGVAELGWR